MCGESRDHPSCSRPSVLQCTEDYLDTRTHSLRTDSEQEKAGRKRGERKWWWWWRDIALSPKFSARGVSTFPQSANTRSSSATIVLPKEDPTQSPTPRRSGAVSSPRTVNHLIWTGLLVTRKKYTEKYLPTHRRVNFESFQQFIYSSL